MTLKAINRDFLFQFTDDTAEGRFFQKAKSGIILTNQDMESQAKFARWGKVVSVGDNVTVVNVGDLVLIDYGKWTTAMRWEDVKYWRSNEEFVCAIGEDESVTFAY